MCEISAFDTLYVQLILYCKAVAIYVCLFVCLFVIVVVFLNFQGLAGSY